MNPAVELLAALMLVIVMHEFIGLILFLIQKVHHA